MLDMNTSIDKLKSGEQMTTVKRTVLIGKMFDSLTNGYMSTYALSKQLNVNRKTIDAYRPLVDKLIAEKRLDRNVIRNLELQRAYKIVEMLMKDLDRTKDDKLRIGYYNQIAKHSSRIALITGLNVETHINVDQQQLVIIRADNSKKPTISLDSQPDLSETTINPKDNDIKIIDNKKTKIIDSKTVDKDKIKG